MRAAAQIAVLSVLYVGFEHLAHRIDSPVPGGVIGAIALALLLLFGVLPLRWFEDGAKVLLDHLALFFVPAAVVAMRAWPAVESSIVAVSVVAVVTTVLVLLLTAKVADTRRGR